MAHEALRQELWSGTTWPGKPIVRVQYKDLEQTFVIMDTMTAEEYHPANTTAPELTARCQNNLKQLGLVCKMFMNEHSNFTPPGWLSVYPEYLSDANVLFCPGIPYEEISYELLFPATEESYLIDVAHAIHGASEVKALSLSQVPLVVGNCQHTKDTLGRNVLYADGHVEVVPEKDWNKRINPFLKY